VEVVVVQQQLLVGHLLEAHQEVELKLVVLQRQSMVLVAEVVAEIALRVVMELALMVPIQVVQVVQEVHLRLQV
jgi:hypothetical protein